MTELVPDDFPFTVSDDSVKTDLEMRHKQCGELLCDVQDGDNFEILRSVAESHLENCRPVEVNYSYRAFETVRVWTSRPTPLDADEALELLAEHGHDDLGEDNEFKLDSVEEVGP
jgi:hypothetical protein